MKYFYKGKHKEATPDFAALAVLEKQHCQSPIIFSWNNYRGQEQTCTSRYRIIHVLDAASDTLKKEYIETKEKPMHPHFKHRPMLIFGKYKNGKIQIENYEETRDYFEDMHCSDYKGDCQLFLDFFPFTSAETIYALHSIGTSYYNIKNLDSLDKIYYGEYMAYVKQRVETAGKNFNELLLRLILNRASVKATKIKNKFAALGAIKNIRSVNDSKNLNLYELNVAIETVIKNDAKIDSSTAIFIDKDHLPLSWTCQPLELYLKSEIAFYFFGDLRDGSLFIDSLASTQDAFVFGDTIYDISMSFPFEELAAYFLPPNISIEEFKLGYMLRYSPGFLQRGKISEDMKAMPECLINSIKKISIKWHDFFDSQQPKELIEIEPEQPFIVGIGINEIIDEKFRCRSLNAVYGWTGCRKSDLNILNNEGVWGRKW